MAQTTSTLPKSVPPKPGSPGSSVASGAPSGLRPAGLARLEIDGTTLELPIVVGSEGERAIDVTELRAKTGCITLDPGYRNTGSCTSEITFIDAENGVLRYRGRPIEGLAESASFLDVAHLLIYGTLPGDGTSAMHGGFADRVREHSALDPGVLAILKGFPTDANAMAMLSASLNGLCAYHPEVMEAETGTAFDDAAAKLLGKTATLVAAIGRHRRGMDVSDGPDATAPGDDYVTAFLRNLTAGDESRDVSPRAVRALDLIFLLHADHEQNCSASTCRMVGSSQANLFASCAAAVCALWGPLHGGANVEIMNQLEEIRSGGIDPDEFIAGVKAKKYRLFGFGHPIYRNYDPRARLLKKAVADVMAATKRDDPLLKIARRLEEVALADDYFTSRKLYPNVDFYSGILMRAMGVPTDMFTAMFAVGRMPGWVAQWKETRDQKGKIYRPRQVYTGTAYAGSHRLPVSNP